MKHYTEFSAGALEWMRARSRAEDPFAAFRFHREPAPGLVRVSAFGAWIDAADLAAFRKSQRDAALVRCDWAKRDPAAVFEVALAENIDDEELALVSMGLNYHDDRGDCLLHVPAFNDAKFLDAWVVACSRRGIERSRVRDARRSSRRAE